MTTRLGARARLLVAASFLAAAFATAAPAAAHQEAEVGGYAVEIGFINEPVFVGDRSGLELMVSKGGQPVEGLEKSLAAEVVFGGQKRPLPLTAREGEPGAYESIFVPTVAGPYTFHLTGTLEGGSIDQAWTSSPDGFNEVQESTAGQFPVQLPTLAELQASAKKGADAAGQVPLALGLGAAGLVAGLLALGIALAGRRRPAA